MINRLESTELMIAKFLRYGVILSGIVLLVGWMLQISFTHNVYLEFAHYGQEDLIHRLSKAYIAQDWGTIISYLGLGILISLPFVRVLLTAVVFVLDQDYLMASCAILVVVGLVLSVTLGFQL